MKASEIKGHCQACGRTQVVLPTNVDQGGMMAKHGYKVRSGYFQGVCSGHKNPPLELSRAFLDFIVGDLERHAKYHDSRATSLAASLVQPEKAIKRDQYGNPVYGDRNPKTYARPVVMVSWADATEFERNKQITLEIGESQSEARFARSHAKSLTALAAIVHGNKLIDRSAEEMAKREKSAGKKAPIAGAFRTKAAQKEALEALNREYSKRARAIKDHYLAQPRGENDDTQGDEVYYAIPFDLHCWRAKHGDLVIKVYPQFEGVVQEINGLFAERLAIKAMPVIK